MSNLMHISTYSLHPKECLLLLTRFSRFMRNGPPKCRYIQSVVMPLRIQQIFQSKLASSTSINQFPPFTSNPNNFCFSCRVCTGKRKFTNQSVNTLSKRCVLFDSGNKRRNVCVASNNNLNIS